MAVTVSLDHPSGAYATVSAIGAFTQNDGPQLAGYQAYLGYARRFSGDSSMEVGLSHTELTQYYRERYTVRYSEAFAGVSGRSLSAHIYYSPDYLGEKSTTLYGSFDWSRATASPWRYFLHAGVLTPLSPKPTDEIRRSQYDLNGGVARRPRNLEFQVILSGFGPNTSLIASQHQNGASATAGLTYFF